jgi:Homoserine acetyltransferase
MEKRFFKIKGKYNLECGDYLSDIEICYHISKEYTTNSKPKKVVWITHALTANSNPAEWWNVLVGEDKFFNPREYTIICANILGSCYGSTSPLSENPKQKNLIY